MDYKKIASDIIENVGGKENIKSMTHCFTRLRFVLRDSKKADKDVVSRLEGVIQVVEAAGQFQVVLGSKVTKVYDQAVAILGGEIGGDSDVEVPAEKQSFGNLLIQKLGEIFTPLVPAIAAAGLIKGLLSAVAKLGWVDSAASTYVILNTASNVIFYFMPIFLAYTAAKALKTNHIIAMMLGAFLCHPTIDAMIQDVATKSTIFGLPVIKMAFTVGEKSKVFAYTESVIPIILAVICLYFLEKWLKKVIPEVLQLILVPGICLIVMLPVMLTVVGPVGIYVGYVIQFLYNALYSFSPILGGIVVGGLWGVCVIFGAHRALLPIGLNDVAMTGYNTLMCFAGAANFSQAGAALGVMLKTKNYNTRQVAASGALSAWLVGVTEPAIYGCNLRLKKPMICAVIAGAVGGGIMGIGRAINYGFANNGILTIMSYYGPDVQLSQFIAYIIGICVAFFGAAALTYIVGFEDDPLPGAPKSAPKNGTKTVTAGGVELAAPVEGTVIPASDIKDEVFASGALGKGIGVIPTSGDVVAPADCTVELVYETKHALGLNVNGVEVLLHIGVNTVELQGKYFETFVENGQQVKKGQKLVHFDLDAMKQAGYDTTVAMLVSNADELKDVEIAVSGPAVISAHC